MDGKEGRRQSRRRSLRFLKPASENKENIVSDVYGSVWLAESDKQESDNHRQSDSFQYDCQNESKALQQSDYQENSGKIQSHGIGKIQTPDNKIGRTQVPHVDGSGTNQSLYQSESSKLEFHSHSENEKDPFPLINNDSDETQTICQDSEKLRSYYLEKIRKQQFPFWGKSDTSVQSFDLRSTHPSLDLNGKSLGFKSCDKSDETQVPCQDETESDKVQVLQPICQDESYRDLPDCHNELVSPQSLCHNDKLQVSCHNEHVELQSSGNSNENQILSQCHSESDHFWSVGHDTPEVMRSASAVLNATPQLSLSLKEAAFGATVETSCTPQTVYSDSKNQKKNALSTTPFCNESECEMDNETSLNNGFYNMESPHVLEKNMDACSIEAVRLQPEDPVVSPASVSLLARIMVNTTCGETSKLKSVENIASSFSNTQVSLISEITDNTSCSDSICSTVTLPSCSGSLQSYSDSTCTAVSLPASSPAERSEQTTAVVSSNSNTPTSTVSSEQRQSIEGFCSAATDRMDSGEGKWSSDNSTDKVVQAAQNTEIAGDGSSVTGTGQSVTTTLTDRSEWDANGTQPDRMDAFCWEQLDSSASKLSSSVALVSFPSSEVHSQGHVVSDETPDKGDGDSFASCRDKTGTISCAIISQQTETVSQKADGCQTIMAHTTESLQDSSDSGKLHSSLSQHNQSLFQDSKQEEKKIKDAKNKRKNRRRSAFGAEFRLDTFLQQSADHVSTPAMQSAQSDSLDPICPHNGEEARMQMIGAISENFTLPKDDQDADRQSDGHASVGKACHEEHQKKEESTRPACSRKKRKSAGTSLKETRTSTSSQDTPAGPDSDSDSSTFTKRRSSLRLYRQQGRRSVDSAAAVDESETESVEMQPLAAVMDTDLSAPEQEGSVSDCEEAEADFDTIPFELERLYRNKNYRKPADKTWETIFESPSKGRETSKQRLKRYIQFTDHAPVSKLKRRLKKAAQNGWDVDSKKFDKSKSDVLKKLEELDNEMSLVDN